MAEAEKSKLQKRFAATAVCKRSRQYFDISLLNKMEKQLQLSRRTPSNPQTVTIRMKFEAAFCNSDAKLTERVQTQLKKRLAKSGRDGDSGEHEASYTIQNCKDKTLDMNKMLARTYFRKDAQINRNQRQFCNFRPYSLPHNYTIDFQKIYQPSQIHNCKTKSSQCQRCKEKQVANAETSSISPPEIGTIKEKLIFNQSLFKTFVDFQQNGKQKAKRNDQVVTPFRHLDKIKMAENLTRKRGRVGMAEFYNSPLKWPTPQMDNRLLKQNEYFIREQNKLDERKVDWTTIKRKVDMAQTRKRDILARKDIRDVKGQFCDQLFFRRNYF